MSSCPMHRIYKKQEQPYLSGTQCLQEKKSTQNDAYRGMHVHVPTRRTIASRTQSNIVVFTKVKAVSRRANRYTYTITAINVKIVIKI